ncbi:FLYWCH-type domain-containing protein [Aphis craccivora]|uniref:FLYWCH-type domain-containing protein n=1 Tax=Aphis craccivora TaxID=307492 RepID=A0A6G0XUU8_APHCR|nr:FLYWCH-type domain-containing protein [Aphis craccivora]
MLKTNHVIISKYLKVINEKYLYTIGIFVIKKDASGFLSWIFRAFVDKCRLNFDELSIDDYIVCTMTNNMEDSNVMFSEKEVYKFSLHKLLKNDIERWRCIHRSCKSFFKYNKNQFIDQNLTHNCDSEKILNKKLKKINYLLHSELKNNDINTLTLYDCKLIEKIFITRVKIFYQTFHKIISNEINKVLNDLNVKSNRQENFLLPN